MYGDASGNIGDLSGNFSDAGGGSGEVSAADINANIDASIDAALNSSTAPSTAPSVSPFDALDFFADANLAGFNAPSNVLGSDLAGGWTDSSGRGVVSQGMNISLGLDPTHGPIGPYAGTNPNTANPEALNQVANTLGISLDALLALAGRDEFGVRDPSQMSMSGLDYGTLSAARDAGLGQLGLTNNQTINEALASKNISDILDYAAPAIAGLVPGYGTISTIGRVGSGLLSGTMTPGQAISAALAGALGARTGVSPGLFEGLFNGNLGRAAGAGVQGGLASLANNLTGSPLGGLALNLSGIGPAVGKGVAEAVGGSNSKSGGLAGALDRGLGTSDWGGLFGGAGVPSTSSAPTGNTYGDTGVNADTYAVLAAIEQAAQEPKQPEWSSQMTAGRYGPLMDYQFGA
jgi:hypothetical protein